MPLAPEARKPPSTGRVTPVTNPASSDTRYITAAAIALTTLAAVPAMAQEVKARMGHVFAANSTMDQAAQEFAKLVGIELKPGDVIQEN